MTATVTDAEFKELNFSDITSHYVVTFVYPDARVVTMDGDFTPDELRAIADRMEGKDKK